MNMRKARNLHRQYLKTFKIIEPGMGILALSFKVWVRKSKDILGPVGKLATVMSRK